MIKLITDGKNIQLKTHNRAVLMTSKQELVIAELFFLSKIMEQKKKKTSFLWIFFSLAFD